MISDEMLYRAAAKSSAKFADKMESGYNHADQHEFSTEFKQKIRKLKQKADHPVFYRTLQRVASILRDIVIGKSA